MHPHHHATQHSKHHSKRLCQHSSRCPTRATFAIVPRRMRGLLRGKLPRPVLQLATWCRQHAPKTAMDVRTRRCEQCSMTASFGQLNGEGDKRQFCKHHAPPHFQLDRRRKCRGGCGQVLLPASGTACANCNVWMRGSVTQPRMVVQFTIAAFLRERVSRLHDCLEMTCERQFCGLLLRPDIVLQARHGMVIVEVDEHQHRGYGYAKERQRMCRLAEVAPCPILVLRFNPHPFRLGRRRQVAQVPFRCRLDALLQWCVFGLRQASRATQDHHPKCQCVYLFFDNDQLCPSSQE